jgi:hypothetical protein
MMEDGLVGETLLDLDVENEIHMDRLSPEGRTALFG